MISFISIDNCASRIAIEITDHHRGTILANKIDSLIFVDDSIVIASG
jgi:hypothetical protein